MFYVMAGTGSFLFIALFELASLKGIPRLKPVFGLLACLLTSYSSVMMLVETPRLDISIYLSVLGAFLLLISTFLLVYSLFLEIPFKKTYVSEGSGEVLIKTGTYALVRHPIVLWLAVLLGSIVLVSRSQYFLIAAPVWLAADVAYVYFEEKFFLEKVFHGYVEYKQETPMLLPTPASLHRCLHSLRRASVKEA